MKLTLSESDNVPLFRHTVFLLLAKLSVILLWPISSASPLLVNHCPLTLIINTLRFTDVGVAVTNLRVVYTKVSRDNPWNVLQHVTVLLVLVLKRFYTTLYSRFYTTLYSYVSYCTDLYSMLANVLIYTLRLTCGGGVTL